MKKENLKDVARKLIAGYLYDCKYLQRDDETKTRQTFIHFLCELEEYVIITDKISEIILYCTRLPIEKFNFFSKSYEYDDNYIDTMLKLSDKLIENYGE